MKAIPAMINSMTVQLSSLLLLLWGCQQSPGLSSQPTAHAPIPLTRVCADMSVQWKPTVSLLQAWVIDSLPDRTALATDLNDSISIGFMKGCFPRRANDPCTNGIAF